MSDAEVDQFFEGLAGRKGQAPSSEDAAGDVPPSAAGRLGESVRSAVLRRRENQRDALLDALERRGLFDDPRIPGARTPVTFLRKSARAYTRWNRPMALAAVLALCAVGVGQWVLVNRGPTPLIERGSPDLIMRTPDPSGTEADLVRRFEAAGAEVQAVQLNDTSWSLSVSLPPTLDAAARDDVRKILKAHGVDALTGDTFTVIVESDPRH